MNFIPSLIACGVFSTGLSHAAISVVDGGFDGTTLNLSGGGSGDYVSTNLINNWAQSAGNFMDYRAHLDRSSVYNQASNVLVFQEPGGYVGQNIGTIEAGTTGFTVSADLYRSGALDHAPVVFSFYLSNGSALVDGTALASATNGLTPLGSLTFPTLLVGEPLVRPGETMTLLFDSAALGVVGQEVLLFVTSPGSDIYSTSTLSAVDNISVTAVPEPSVALLGAFAALAWGARRSRR